MEIEDKLKKTGFVAISNEIAEALARTNLSEYESRSLWVILRKTYGWNKNSDLISIGQFAKITGKDGANIFRAIRRLEDKKIVLVNNKERINSYSINPNTHEWKIDSITIVRNDNGVSTDNNVPSNKMQLSLETKTSLSPATNTIDTNKKTLLQNTSNSSNTKNKSDLAILVEYYQRLYTKKFGAKPTIGKNSWGKYGRLFKAKLDQGISPKEVVLALRTFSKSPDSSPSRLGFDLGIFLSDSVFNKMRALSIKSSEEQEAEDKYGKY
ncbi:hypothetical protein A2619_03990 [candidate division WWE3 bacterium RIFOXYD1_FULL_39_9]|uniref:Bacteriophage lambda Replication protein O N-terminal domain-containing protein n=1 Tax=candidate division WWE3 bacterium RIFOXYD1_FULL_39_9 TaxID=1802649 RepID=A0A1F4X9E6_UNCKA|nr:MAG: hypothetical protein A2619_03990 [candidate division WWE3 bacterium RIFOXYD1_FULL_39_9]